MFAISAFIAMLIALFVYYNEGCSRPDSKAYGILCRACHRSDLCEERWESEYISWSTNYELYFLSKACLL